MPEPSLSSASASVIETEVYAAQKKRWPSSGRHILAAFDDERIVVYQAYRPDIGHFAATNGYFGGSFSLSRMSWIKPNFLWMMYRCGWAQKRDQEVVLAVSIARAAFDSILASAVHSSFVPEVYADRDAWKAALKSSDVRLQWDPDHNPAGGKLERRAIQLGLRGATLASYARDWIIDIEDVTGFVTEQRANIGDHDALRTPAERVYPVGDSEVAKRLGLQA